MFFAGFALFTTLAVTAPVTPQPPPGQFQNSPTTQGAQGGQESVTIDNSGKVRSIGRTRTDTGHGVTTRRRQASKQHGTTRNGVYVAPRSTLPPHP